VYSDWEDVTSSGRPFQRPGLKGKKGKERRFIAHRRVRRKAGGQAGGSAVKSPLMRSRH